MKRFFVLAIVSIGLGLNVDGRTILPVMQPSLMTQRPIRICDFLVGIISLTYPGYMTIFHDYNDLESLKLIHDHQDNTLQHYDYHYYNESQGGAQ